MHTIEFKQQQQNPDTVPLFKAVGDYRRQLGYEETIRKLELMTEWTKELYVQEYDRALREQPLKGVSYLGRFISPHQMTDPLEWFKDQARLFHRDQRLKRLSRERLERAGTEAATRRKLADIDDTDDERGRSEDWGHQGEIIKKGMTADSRPSQTTPAEPHLAQNGSQCPANWKWRRLRGWERGKEGGQGGRILGRLGGVSSRRKSKGSPDPKLSGNG